MEFYARSNRLVSASSRGSEKVIGFALKVMISYSMMCFADC